MVYLKSFKLPSEKDEDGVILNTGTHQLNMSCYTDTPYPFKLFPKKQLQSIEFEPVTMFMLSYYNISKGINTDNAFKHEIDTLFNSLLRVNSHDENTFNESSV